MRIIAPKNLADFAARHPETRAGLQSWKARIEAQQWVTTSEVQSAFPKAKVLNGERIRFQIAGGDYRLIVAFKFTSQIAFIKFIGTHAEYDRVDALSVALF